MKKLILTTVIMLLFTAVAQANPPILVDRNTGKYLGNLSSNKYDINSVSNPYGPYGSKHSLDSINNPHGQYGSRYSQDSPNNPYATNAPAIIAPGSGSYGYGGRY